MSERLAASAALLGVGAGSPEAEVLELMIRLAVQAVGAREGSYFVYDVEGGDLVLALTTAGGEDAPRLVGRRVPLGTGVTGFAAATREVQIGAPRYHFEDAGGTPPPPEGESLIAAPVLWQDELLGVLTAVSFDPERRFTQGHASLYGSVATVAALVLQQHRRIQDLERALRADLVQATVDGPESDTARITRSIGRLARIAETADIARLLETIESIAAARDDA